MAVKILRKLLGRDPTDEGEAIEEDADQEYSAELDNLKAALEDNRKKREGLRTKTQTIEAVDPTPA